jgi:hypothetical protein
VQSGLLYALAIFAVGFLFGTGRMLLLVPHLGATIAVLVEVPFMLMASWWMSRMCVACFKVSATPGHRILMGLMALVTLNAAEIGLAVVAFGESPMRYLMDFESPAGAIGLSAQLAFASFPLLQMRRTRRGEYPPYGRKHRQ